MFFDKENSTEEALFFNGLSFAGRQTTLIMLLFMNNKFCKSAVYIKPKLDAYAVDNYKEIKSELNLKYFVTEDDFELYDEPYEKNDGYTENGISVGKVSFSAYWKFHDANGGLDDFIVLKISEDFDIIINYEDGDLIEDLSNKVKSKNSEDY